MYRRCESSCGKVFLHIYAFKNNNLQLTTEIFSFSRSLFLLFLVFFVRGVRFVEETSLPTTPSIFFFLVLVPPFEDVTTVELVDVVSSRLSLYDEEKYVCIVHNMYYI